MKKLAAILIVTSALTAQESVKVRHVNDRRATGFFAELSMTLELPKIKASEVAASRVIVKSATDETGRDLVDAEKGEPPLQLSMGRSADQNPATVSLSLKNPDRKATKVKEVRGEIELYLPGKDPNSVAEIAKFTTMSGKALSHKALKANGVEISMVSAAQLEAEKKKRAEAKKKEYAEMGYEGDDLATMVTDFLGSLLGAEENDLYVRIKDPKNAIQNIAYVDAAGEVKMVNAREDEGFTLLSTWSGKPQADWKLRVSMKTAKNVVRMPFALNDVPLP
jgi:hypothetical protein